mgnify:FL=1
MKIADLRISHLRGVRPLPNLDARFRAHIVATAAGCWEWRYHLRTPSGYGLFQIPVESPRGPAWRTESAHRLVYEAIHGPIPPEVEVMHACDHPPCLRPNHLVKGTPKLNGEDRARKGRGIRGERVRTAKLTTAQVVAIRERYAAGLESAQAIADGYGLEKGETVLAIVQGRSWSHVGGTRTIDDRRRAEANRNTKLDADRVRAIRASRESLSVLARRYAVSKQTIAAILARETWRHVP